MRAFSKNIFRASRAQHSLCRRNFNACSGILPRRSFSVFASEDRFAWRHLGPSQKETSDMLGVLGLKNTDELLEKVVPPGVNSGFPKGNSIELDGKSETDSLKILRKMADKNVLGSNFIGQGYYGTKTPAVIMRNMLENPSWYTAYTPYQAEVSQGRLEMLLNFQTMVKDLVGMDVANCSLLDEGSAAAEVLSLALTNSRHKRKKFFVSYELFEQSVACIRTRAEFLGVDLVVGDEFEFLKSSDEELQKFSGAIVQYPNKFGVLTDYEENKFAEKMTKNKVLFAVATDLLALTQVKPPGEFGADIVVGSAQRFGVPLFFGGPHAGYMAVKESLVRLMPGRIIGVSVDASGKPAMRMALQTREQFIRREKATSNICTAQALLANMAAAYGVYHGPDHLKEISENVHLKAKFIAEALSEAGVDVTQKYEFFDTIAFSVEHSKALKEKLARENVNIWYHSTDDIFTLSTDEQTTEEDLVKIIHLITGKKVDLKRPSMGLGKFQRESKFMTNPVFTKHRSETKMLRYLASLEAKDITLRNSMIPLGSCTMKLNATSELAPVGWPEFKDVHPFAPKEQTEGYREMISGLNDYLAHVTGFHKVSSQPNSGATGEYTGLLLIRRYLEKQGESHRNVCLIPQSAHGTNPASAAMAGMKVIGVKNDSTGSVDMKDLKAKCEKFKDTLGAVMITYPSTYGVFESGVKEIVKIVNDYGGLVYMDGANMNAQLGITSPGDLGADVCHLNLHKTFAIPHGGGGPGVGSIGVSERLAPFLPDHCSIDISEINGNEGGVAKSIGQVASAPFGSAGILPISWMFITMLGKKGLRDSAELAILNANYMAKRLSEHYGILFLNEHGFCAHEFILDLRFLSKYGLSETDVAKRLADFGFHAATVSWPAIGTIMIEPTESESQEECDRYIDALVKIREEIQEVIDGKVSVEDSILKHAPHSIDTVLNEEEWKRVNRPYTREQAAFPLEFVKRNKVWPSARVDNVHGDRNLICSCPTVDEMSEEEI